MNALDDALRAIMGGARGVSTTPSATLVKERPPQPAAPTSAPNEPRSPGQVIDPLGGIGRAGDGLGACRTKNGDPCGRAHAGVDIMAPSGTPIQAIDSGVVTRSGQSSGLGGLFVEVRHDNGLVTGSYHLREDSPIPRPGTRVNAGDTIGLVGKTGNTSTDHLHLEVRNSAGQVLNPLDFFRGGSSNAIIAGASPIRSNRQIPVGSDVDRAASIILGSSRGIPTSIITGTNDTHPRTGEPLTLGDVGSAVDSANIGQTLVSNVDAIPRLVGFLLDPSNWLRVAYFILALISLYFGGKMLMEVTRDNAKRALR